MVKGHNGYELQRNKTMIRSEQAAVVHPKRRLSKQQQYDEGLPVTASEYREQVTHRLWAGRPQDASLMQRRFDGHKLLLDVLRKGEQIPLNERTPGFKHVHSPLLQRLGVTCTLQQQQVVSV